MDSASPQPPTQSIGSTLGVKFYRFRSVIRRHWWILLLTIGIGLAYEAYVLFTKPRLFESVSRLIVREELIQDKTWQFQDTTGNFFATTLESLKSPLVLERAQRRLAVEAPQLAGSAEINPSIQARSNIFTVAGSGRHPEYTQRFVDAVVKEFMESRAELRQGTRSEVGQQLNDQITETRKELEQYKSKLREFKEENNTVFWTDQLKTSGVRLSGHKAHQEELKNELLRLETLSSKQLLTSPPTAQAPKAPAENARPSVEQPETGARSGAIANSGLYAQYVAVTQQLTQKLADLDEWKTVWKSKHPKLQAIEADVNRLQRLLEVIEKQNESATESRREAIRAELKSLEVIIQAWEEKVRQAGGKDAEYQAIDGDVTRTQAQLEKLLSNYHNLGGGSASGTDPLVVMQSATPPVEVPRGTAKHLLTGLAGGLLIGGLILLLLDRADDRLSSSTEMLNQFSEPILGQIPNVIESRNATGLPLLQDDDERYTYAEAFRSLRSSLIFMPNQSDLRTVLITSAIPNEGKSTVASNLAVTMAASGARVLLVDADLRRGDIAQLFDINGNQGLSNILRGEIPWKDTLQTTKYPTLSIIPRGPVTNQSGELLLKPMVVPLLAELKEAYDLVIFNTAPILATDDTPTLAPNFDGALMVIRAQFTSARLTQNSLNALYQRQVNVLGLILNCVDTEMPDYYYYRYPKYYAA